MRLLFHILARLPLRALQAIGAFIGRLLWLVPNSRKRTTLANLALCFPDMDPAERARLARTSLIHEMQSVLEMPYFWLAPRERMLASIQQTEGEELLDAALARGKGLLLLTMHLGAWEAAAHAYSMKRPITGIYKPQGGAIEELGLQGRSRTGAKLIPTAGGTVRQKALPVLAANEAIYFMPDQDPPEGRGIFAPYFGVSAHSPVLVSKLVQESGAAVIFMYSERLPGARGFVAHYRAAPDEIASEDLLTSVTAMNRGIEACVRECPEQYWWGYKRFRRRPPGEAAIYV